MNIRRLTTEQLMKKVIQDVGRMTPEHKAKMREALEKAFPRKESK